MALSYASTKVGSFSCRSGFLSSWKTAFKTFFIKCGFWTYQKTSPQIKPLPQIQIPNMIIYFLTYHVSNPLTKPRGVSMVIWSQNPKLKENFKQKNTTSFMTCLCFGTDSGLKNRIVLSFHDVAFFCLAIYLASWDMKGDQNGILVNWMEGFTFSILT